jgi:hypothetical protein
MELPGQACPGASSVQVTIVSLWKAAIFSHCSTVIKFSLLGQLERTNCFVELICYRSIYLQHTLSCDHSEGSAVPSPPSTWALTCHASSGTGTWTPLTLVRVPAHSLHTHGPMVIDWGVEAVMVTYTLSRHLIPWGGGAIFFFWHNHWIPE